MTNKEVLTQFWTLAAEKEGWYPPYADALKDVDAELANWRPEGVAANTIWETVAHVIFYKERLLRRLHGEADIRINSNDETFVVSSSDPQAWKQTVGKLFSIHAQLKQELENFGESDLDKPMKKDPVGAQYMNLIVHDAYHTGQIVFIRKLKGEWPEKRSFS